MNNMQNKNGTYMEFKTVYRHVSLPGKIIHSSICDLVASNTLSFGTTLSTNPIANASSAVYLLLPITAFSATPLPTTVARELKILVKR